MTEKAVVKVKDIQNEVLTKVKKMEENREIYFPKNYSPENALKSAFLVLQQTKDKAHRPALSICTRESVANALLDMVVQGLSPSKNQVYFIVRGSELCADRSYFGTVAMVKRLKGVLDCFAQPVYKNDEFEFEIIEARKVVTKHTQTLESIEEGTIRACYATILYKDADGTAKEYSDIMTMRQVEKSWEKSKSTQKTVHKDYPSEMARRTVLNRCCKMFINSSDDEALDMMIHSFNRTDGREETDEKDLANSGDVIDVTEDGLYPDPVDTYDEVPDPEEIEFGKKNES